MRIIPNFIEHQTGWNLPDQWEKGWNSNIGAPVIARRLKLGLFDITWEVKYENSNR